MKKIIYLSLFLLLANLSNLKAQHNLKSEVIPTSLTEQPWANEAREETKNVCNGWYNYGHEMYLISGNTLPHYRNYLFPDSTVKANFSTGVDHVWKHSFGEVLDPTSTFYSCPVDIGDSYNLDSVGIWYRYYRFQHAAPDTLVVQFFLSN